MKKCLLVVFILAVIGSFFRFFPFQHGSVRADDDNGYQYLAQQMTKDDEIDIDGMTIQQFAKIVLNSNEVDRLYDFDKFIPRNCLIPSENPTNYYYFGVEYGFYVRHRKVQPININGGNPNAPVNVVDIMIVDFTYQETKKIEHSVKIEVLFSESFFIGVDDKDEIYFSRIIAQIYLGEVRGSGPLYQEYREKLAIVRPQFMTSILNANTLNFGDPGYSKATDDGLIIQQSRINYAGEVVLDSFNGEELGEFLVEKLICYTLSIADCGIISSILSETLDWGNVVSGFPGMSKGSKVCNNEDNILLNESKDNQKKSIYESFSRSIIVSPVDDIVLRQGGYVENIILLNDTTSATRMDREFGFSVFAQEYNGYGRIEFLNEKDDNGNMLPFVVKNENKILYEEETPVEVRSDTQENLYILPGGEQTYIFQPYSSGKFLITVPFGVGFSVTDNATGEEIQFSLVPDRTTEKSRSYTAELNKQTEYLLTVNGNEQIIDHIRITFSPEKLPRKQSVVSFKDEKEKYFALDAVDSYYYLTKSDASLNMQLLDENLNLIASLDNSYEFYAENKVRYLFLFYAHENTSDVKMELWERKRISFYGSGVDEPQWIVNTDLSFILPTPSREGYIFEGWYFNSRYDGEKATPESVCAYAGPDINLYAQWRIDSEKIYQINYVIPDTVYDDKNEIIDSSLIEFQNRIDSFKVTDEVILPILNSEVYHFMGWYTDSDFKNKITKIPQGTIGDKTLYAKIELKEFIISFDLNGGSGDVASQHVKYGKEIQLPTVSRAGYAGNWNAWNGEKSNFGYGYTVYKTETLRAVWRKIYNITYHNVNSRGIVYLHYEKEDAYLKQYYFSDINFDLSRIDVRVSEGKRSKCLRFSGWYTNSDLSDPIARIQKGRTGNINLYAKWAFSVSETHTKEQRVTDADHFSQVTDNNLFYLGRMAEMYQSDLKALGLTNFKFTVSFDMKEENNGNQFMFVFDSKYQDTARCYYYKG
ncbi:MAG: InlB B-repeat-containing protein, partial [Candidatus Borkfalkiaceae bacterium]|nr:InlB B-repeat-containing protein [Christensenellaceae bacterium]